MAWQRQSPDCYWPTSSRENDPRAPNRPDINQKTLWLTGDDPEARAILNNISLARLQNLVGQNEVLVMDEAQRFANAGLMLKLITGQLNAFEFRWNPQKSPRFPASFLELYPNH